MLTLARVGGGHICVCAGACVRACARARVWIVVFQQAGRRAGGVGTDGQRQPLQMRAGRAGLRRTVGVGVKHARAVWGNPGKWVCFWACFWPCGLWGGWLSRAAAEARRAIIEKSREKAPLQL